MKKRRKKNKQVIHTATQQEHLQNIPFNTLINETPPKIYKEELQLPRVTRRLQAQLRAQKSPLLREHLHIIGAADDPSCPLCGYPTHNTLHLFSCPRFGTRLNPKDLWIRPVQVASLQEKWQTELALAEEARGAAVRQLHGVEDEADFACSDLPPS